MKPYLKNTITNIFTASSFLLLAVCVFTSSCSSNKPEEIQAIGDREEMASLIVKDLETVITDSGKVKYRLLTPEMYQYPNKEEPYTDFPKGLNVIIYLPDGSVDGQIKCNNAIYYEKKQLFELNNDVEAISQKNEILNTEQLFWDMEKETIYSEKFVKITSEEGIWMGTGFESDQTMSNWELKNPTGEMQFDTESTN